MDFLFFDWLKEKRERENLKREENIKNAIEMDIEMDDVACAG